MMSDNLASTNPHTEVQKSLGLSHNSPQSMTDCVQSPSSQTEEQQRSTFSHNSSHVIISNNLGSTSPHTEDQHSPGFSHNSPHGMVTHGLVSVPLQNENEEVPSSCKEISQDATNEGQWWMPLEIEDQQTNAFSNGISEATKTQSSRKAPPQTAEQISAFRQILPQAFVTGVNSLLFLSAGMLTGYPALLIPVLTNASAEDDLHFSTEEASWYGALTYVFQPIGAIISGSSLQSLGCKKLMILINIPIFGCWLLIYFAESTLVLFVSSALAGAVLGLIEAPSIRYVSETSHPALRGILTTCSTFSFSLGILAAFFLGSLTTWRQVALISGLLPIFCAILLFQVPETPMWLMSKGRPEAALQSLQWLRGRASAEMVNDEFEKLEFYKQKKSIKILCSYQQEVDTKDETDDPTTIKETPIDDTQRCEPIGDAMKQVEPRVSFQFEECEKRSFGDKVRDLTRREMLTSLGMCFGLCSVFCFGGVPPLRPYLLQVFAEMNLPMQASWTSVWVALVGIIGNIACMFLIKRMKKKPLLIFSLASSAVCLIFLAVFVMQSSPFLGEGTSFSRWWPLVFFMIYFFCDNVGISPITFIYIGEILPYRGRGIATAIVMSFFYVITFVAVKSFATMEQYLGLHGIFLFFAAASVVGIFFTCYCLPETEGRFLSDIETDITQDVRSISAERD